MDTQVPPTERKPEWIHAVDELRTACSTAQEQNRSLHCLTYGISLNGRNLYEIDGNEACAIGYYMRGREGRAWNLVSTDAARCLGVTSDWCQGFNAGFQGYQRPRIDDAQYTPHYLDGMEAGYRLCQQFKPKGAIRA
jgi:hypothetical protein